MSGCAETMGDFPMMLQESPPVNSKPAYLPAITWTEPCLTGGSVFKPESPERKHERRKSKPESGDRFHGSVTEQKTELNNSVVVHMNGTIQNHACSNGEKDGGGKDMVNKMGGEGGGEGEEERLEEEEEGEEEEVRQTWDKKLDFLLAIVGFAIDLGNVWRFPYICYKNGGGAFLIPYLLMLVFLGLPLFFMELSLGQFHRKGPITIWRQICPMFCGIGFGICIVGTFVGAYYNTIIAYAIYYLVMTFRPTLVYARCDNDWNTPVCVEPSQLTNRTNTSVSAAVEFFNYHVLEAHRSKGIDDLGSIRWQLLLCLVVVFIVIFFCCWKGTKSTGKAVWVTATLPFFVLFVLLVRGMTLPGAINGVLFYLRPNFSRIGHVEVWVDAAAQIFFSLGPGFGALIALSSYNKFHNNCFRDAVVTSCINCGTSFVAGIVVFSVLGYMAHIQHTDIDSVATHGPGLVFVVYVEAISTLAGSHFWAILFFLMLIALGLDSTFGGLEGVMTALADEFGIFRKRRTLVVAVVCGYCFLTGLPTVTYGGTYFIYLMDTHAAPISLLFICFTEVIAVNWFYGVGRFSSDIETMLGHSPHLFWKVCWTVVSPLGLFLLFVLSFVGYQRLSLDGYVYPVWAEVVGWIVTCVSVVCIPGYILFSFLTAHGTVAQRWRRMTTPQLETSLGSPASFSTITTTTTTRRLSTAPGGGAGGAASTPMVLQARGTLLLTYGSVPEKHNGVCRV